jgi:hypothetical protein
MPGRRHAGGGQRRARGLTRRQPPIDEAIVAGVLNCRIVFRKVGLNGIPTWPSTSSPTDSLYWNPPKLPVTNGLEVAYGARSRPCLVAACDVTVEDIDALAEDA